MRQSKVEVVELSCSTASCLCLGKCGGFLKGLGEFSLGKKWVSIGESCSWDSVLDRLYARDGIGYCFHPFLGMIVKSCALEKRTTLRMFDVREMSPG